MNGIHTTAQLPIIMHIKTDCMGASNTYMTQAIERVFDHMPVILDKNKVCQNCRDKTRCDDCAFNN